MLPGTTYDQCTKVLGSGGMRSSLGGGLPREWKGTRQDSERVGIRPESLADRVEISGAHTSRGAFSTALMKHFAERLRRWNLGLVFISYLHPDRSKETWGGRNGPWGSQHTWHYIRQHICNSAKDHSASEGRLAPSIKDLSSS